MRQADRQHEDDAGGEASGGDGVRMVVNEASAKYLVPQFKRTEAGDIPMDWVDTPIGAIAEVTSGGTPSRKVPAFWSGDIPWVTTAELDCGEIKEASQFITTAGLQSSAAKWLPAGTLLVALYGQGKTRGKCAALRIAATTNQACAAIKLADVVDSDFVRHNLAHRYEYIRSLSNGGSQENLSGAIIKQIRVGMPPARTEQHAIAKALTDADALIDSLEQLLTKKRQIKQGAMQELLTGKRRLLGFSRTNTNGDALLPSDWEPQAIGDFAEVKTGPFGSALHERDYVQSGIPIITVEHLAERGIQGEGAPQVGEGDLSRLQAYKLEESDIVFSRVGSIDRNARVSAAEVGWLFSGRLLRLRLKSKEVDSQFLSYLFHGEPFRNQVERVAVGQTMASLNTKLLSGLEVVLPTVAEQKAIAESLASMDTDLTALEARLSKARALKQAMAQALLTGRIRLVEGAA